MKKFLLAYLLALGLAAVAAAPAARLTVDRPEPLVTEEWRAKIVLYLEPLTGRFAEVCPLAAPSSSPFPSFFESHRTGLAIRNFPVEGVRFSHSLDREELGGVNYWRVTLTSEPIPAERPGTIEVGPVVVEATLFDGRFQRGFFGNEAHTVTRAFTAPRVVVRVSEPPLEDRPAEYCGAIGSNVTVSAALDANVCTAGDPLMLTLAVAGAIDPSRVRAPDVAQAVEKGGRFRVDRASMKSQVRGGEKVFTWRIRSRKAGTMELASVPIAYFDTVSRKYRRLNTESLPVQVKAGEQVALALGEAETEDSWPMPDGIDLDFPAGGNADFTFHRAVSAAVRATREAEFAAAARAYAEYLGRLDDNPMATFAPLRIFGARARLLARHMDNLGALRLMGGDARGAVAACLRASELAGDTPSRLRSLRAALARLKNDPRAELPLPRVLCPVFFRLSLAMRILAALAGLLVLALAWWAAGRLGRSGALALAVTLAAFSARAQWPFGASMGGRAGQSVEVSAKLVPAEAVVGEPCALMFVFEVEKGVDVDQLQIRNLPDPDGGKLAYGELERFHEAPASRDGFVVHRVRLPVRFNAPFQGEIAPHVSGMLVVRRGNASSFSFTSSMSFSRRCAPFELDVRPLPAEGRPADFSGMVGRNFQLRLRLSPEKVRPGDLVTAQYILTFDGHCPTNRLPQIQGLTDEFKVYEPKETARNGERVEWRQMLVPRTAAATNALRLTANYYDVGTKRYALAQSRAARLVFIADTVASTSNTTVVIDAPSAPATGNAAGRVQGEPIELRFAPSPSSPVVAVLPPGSPLVELSRHGSWRRVAAGTAIGWVK